MVLTTCAVSFDVKQHTEAFHGLCIGGVLGCMCAVHNVCICLTFGSSSWLRLFFCLNSNEANQVEVSKYKKDSESC